MTTFSQGYKEETDFFSFATMFLCISKGDKPLLPSILYKIDRW